MNDRLIHAACIVLVLAGLTFAGFVYVTAPRSMVEVVTKGQVALGTYAVDQKEFDAGVAAFKRDEFAEARSHFDRADPEKRDARTQFYVGYSFYRQGWGRLTSDDALFTSGLQAADRAIALDPNFRSTDDTLVMKTPFELKNELEDGIEVTISDFNPLKVTRTRK